MSLFRFASLLLIFIAVSTCKCHAAASPRRARPPQWSRDVLNAFFEDAREQLVGARPQGAERAETEQLVAKPANVAQNWSALIEAETLTTEIKRINNQLATALKKSARFQGGGNLVCRRDFGLLAVLFGVIDQYDTDVRWQQSAKLMQDRCFLTSQACETSSAESYAAARETQAMLAELLRGQAPTGESPQVPTDVRPLVDRAQLMQSMELAFKERLSPALANAREFRKRSQVAFEQAQLLAVLAKVIQEQGYDYADDDTYLNEALQLRSASSELSQAAQEKNYEAARAAAGRVSQSCSRCHEDFRG